MFREWSLNFHIFILIFLLTHNAFMLSLSQQKYKICVSHLFFRAPRVEIKIMTMTFYQIRWIQTRTAEEIPTDEHHKRKRKKDSRRRFYTLHISFFEKWQEIFHCSLCALKKKIQHFFHLRMKKNRNGNTFFSQSHVAPLRSCLCKFYSSLR